MGDDFWPYGVSANLKDLQALCRYSLAQHLAPKALEPAALFHPETVD